MAASGELEHLRIEAFLKPERTGKPVAEFRAYVNPSEITLGYEIEYDAASGAGSTGSRMDFKKIKPGDLSLSFFIDGTGANGRKVDVQAEIRKFQDATLYDGDIHRTKYLKLAWGKLQIKRCVLKSASIVYKLFDSHGVPLRAVISATFTDNSDDATRVAMQQDKSADLTYVRLVKAGDALPSLCQAVYGEPRLYLEVARVNGLDNFRALPAGMQLRFPPLAK